MVSLYSHPINLLLFDDFVQFYIFYSMKGVHMCRSFKMEDVHILIIYMERAALPVVKLY